MGLSGSKQTSTTKPVYSAQIEGAANNVNNAYASQAGKISGVTDQLATLVPNLVSQYQNGGDANTRAATAYNTDVLGGKYLDAGNPYLEQQVATTNANTRNGLAASLGTRGLTGGSAFADIITRGLAENESGLRYTDYNNERARMGQAAALAPGLSASSQLPIQSLLSIAQAQQMPIQAAAGAGSAVGGLLGQYGTTTQKSSQSLGGLIAQLAGTGLSAFGSGIFGGSGSSGGLGNGATWV